MSTDTILDRLLLCNGEITSVARVWRLQPDEPILPGVLPCIFMRPLGMTQPTPRTAPRRYLVTRRWLLTLLTAPSTGASIDSSSEGSKKLADAVPFLDYIIDYYANHPRLHTTAGAAELNDISDDVLVQDGGVQGNIPGPDGATYVGILATLIIEEQRTATRSST